MGTEILSIFILVPIALWLFDLMRMIHRKKANKHALLLVIGVATLGYMSLSSYLGGWNPMQGFIIGSVFYGPIYFFLFFAISTITKIKGSTEESSKNT